MLTPIQAFDGWWAKRDELDENAGTGIPSGIKLRNFLRLIDAMPGAPVVIGCAASSTAQVAAAAAGNLRGVAVYVFTPARAKRTPATEYAAGAGAVVQEVRPGYLTVCQARARAFAESLLAATVWETGGVAAGSFAQAGNVPLASKRVIVPTGAGATCAGVLAGLAGRGYKGRVLAVAVSPMATAEGITEMARGLTGAPLPPLDVVRAAGGYEAWATGWLPNRTALDPFYAAKALPYVRPGDVLWVPGCRPLAAMPEKARAALKGCIAP